MEQKINLPIPDQRMLQLMEWAVKNDLVSAAGEYWEKIGFPRTNISNVKKGTQGFTREHIKSACIFTGASANWILGIDKAMFRETTAKDALQLLKEATAAIEMELASRGKNKPKKPDL